MKTQTQTATRNELLRENARLRGDLLTIAHRIGHDLRTPLGGIVTSSEILKEILVEHQSPSAPLVSPIIDSAEGLAKIIERVSFVLKASVNPPAKERVKMGEIVFRATQRLERKILKNNAILSEPPAWPEVTGIFSWLEVVWGNLLANALQYGKGRIELGWREENREFRFWICDNGSGVAPERQAALFQPFHSLHELDATGGLGLSIVQRLVELQGGNCGYEPLSADGSVFFFTLPADSHAGLTCSSPAQPERRSATKDARFAPTSVRQET
jgi:signal transduction histidine kinase